MRRGMHGSIRPVLARHTSPHPLCLSPPPSINPQHVSSPQSLNPLPLSPPPTQGPAGVSPRRQQDRRQEPHQARPGHGGGCGAGGREGGHFVLRGRARHDPEVRGLGSDRRDGVTNNECQYMGTVSYTLSLALCHTANPTAPHPPLASLPQSHPPTPSYPFLSLVPLRANAARATESTAMNAESSRSHSVFMMYITGTRETTQTRLTGERGHGGGGDCGATAVLCCAVLCCAVLCCAVLSSPIA